MRALFKKFKKRIGKGITFLVVPNSYGSLKSFSIPFPVIFVIMGIIIFNIYVFFAYTTQIGEIDRFHKRIYQKDTKITKLLEEQKEVTPTLKRSYEIAEELSKLKNERARIEGTLKSIQQQGGRVSTQVSRGAIVRTQSVQLKRDANGEDEVVTELAKLNNNLEQLEKYIEQEAVEQKTLLQQLLSYEKKLNHTPSKWPVMSRRITSRFGNRLHPTLKTYRLHTGVDIKVSRGSKVQAAADGVVSFSGYRGGYGYAIIINHGYNYQTLYAHNSKLLVSVGTKVSKGQLICYSGNSGTSTGPHLHYEVQVNGKPVNPVMFLRN